MWLIEAYRTQHGASFAREVLTVAAGTFPDANAIMVFTSFPVADELHWRESDTGNLVHDLDIRTKLDNWVDDYLGTYPDTKRLFWRECSNAEDRKQDGFPE